jgi:hypothetical protein
MHTLGFIPVKATGIIVNIFISKTTIKHSHVWKFIFICQKKIELICKI